MKEVFNTFLGVAVAFIVLAVLIWGEASILRFFVDDGPLWGLVAGVLITLAFVTFWVHMRKNYWH